MAQGLHVVFSDATPGASKMAMWRAAVALMQLVPSPAVCQATPGSERFLERLGWIPSALGEGVYEWHR